MSDRAWDGNLRSVYLYGMASVVGRESLIWLQIANPKKLVRVRLILYPTTPPSLQQQ
jgi:hypothetical protein